MNPNAIQWCLNMRSDAAILGMVRVKWRWGWAIACGRQIMRVYRMEFKAATSILRVVSGSSVLLGRFSMNCLREELVMMSREIWWCSRRDDRNMLISLEGFRLQQISYVQHFALLIFSNLTCVYFWFTPIIHFLSQRHRPLRQSKHHTSSPSLLFSAKYFELC